MLLNLANRTNSTRQVIQKHIERHPGIHFNKLIQELDIATGQGQHHLRQLLIDDQIVKTHLYGRTHYYPPGYEPWEQNALALLRRETAREILFYLLEHEQATPREIIESLEIARSTLEWHLDHLVEQELIQKHSQDQNSIILTIAQPERTVQLLTRVVPSVSDRLTDRFLRFIDHLFESTDHE